VVHPDGVLVEAAQSFKTRLLVDAMGHFSAMMQQRGRGKTRWRLPGGRKLCPRISQKNDGDLLVSFTPLQNQCHTSGKPSSTRRQNHLLTYMDAHPDRLGLEALFEDYLRLMPSGA